MEENVALVKANAFIISITAFKVIYIKLVMIILKSNCLYYVLSIYAYLYAFQMQSEYFETVNLLNRELEQVQLDLK